MYSNIGKKIKGLAVGVCVVEAIGAVICGILLCIEEEAFAYVLISIFGPIVAWVSSWLLYGFGEFVDNIGKIEENTRNKAKPSGVHQAHVQHVTEKKKTEITKQEFKNQPEKSKDQPNKISEIAVKCPECGEKLFFYSHMSAGDCPYCGCNVKIDK